MTLRSLAGIALGHVPALSPNVAREIATQAWEDLKDARRWSWLYRDTVIQTPANVSTGTANVTLFSNSITFDATALAAINATATATTPVVGRQFRHGQDGHVYTIKTYDSGTGVATLDQVFRSTSNATATFQLYKAYHQAPGGIDFFRFESIIDPDNGYRLRLDFVKADFDRKDPQRQAFGNPYRVGYLRADDLDGDGTNVKVPVYEFWPHPTERRGYLTQYVTRGSVDRNGVASSSLAFEFPNQEGITDALREYVLAEACLWAEKSKGTNRELRGTNWMFLAGDHRKRYTEKLRELKRNDDEIATVNWIEPDGTYYDPPIDAAFWQSHDVPYV